MSAEAKCFGAFFLLFVRVSRASHFGFRGKTARALQTSKKKRSVPLKDSER
jgi:hypothetical protein